MIVQAVAAVSTSTGLRFVADGPTSEGPSEDRRAYQPDLHGDRWSPVLIAWATPDEVPDFGVDIAGEAGPGGVTTSSGDQTYVSGIVYLDGAQLEQISASSGVAAATSVVAHELGHLVGLAHLNDPGQLIYPCGVSLVHYGAGDLAAWGPSAAELANPRSDQASRIGRLPGAYSSSASPPDARHDARRPRGPRATRASAELRMSTSKSVRP